MLSHTDYHAHLLLLELGFRGIQWLRAMDYEGLLKGVDKQSHHTEQEDVFLCVCVCLCVICPAIQNNIKVPLHISLNRKLGNK